MPIPPIAESFAKLKVDVWRKEYPFSPEMGSFNARILAAQTYEDVAILLREWLQKHQSCRFGRFAAGKNMITFCIIDESEIINGDERAIRDKIMRFRREWRREAIDGKSSGFIIFVRSKKILRALPDVNLMNLAKRIASLYLLEWDLKEDGVYTDRVGLEIPAGADPAVKEVSRYEWRVGVNFFSSQGDGRWWNDHRIPGGMAFSMNSVGHMVRSGMLHNMGKGTKGRPIAGKLPVESLGDALYHAMQTIAGATKAVSGEATCLKPLESPMQGCPIRHDRLNGKDYKSYFGWYDTDVTVPLDYFRADVGRPADVARRDLDFTYLFDDSLDNPEHETMARGVRIE